MHSYQGKIVLRRESPSKERKADAGCSNNSSSPMKHIRRINHLERKEVILPENGISPGAVRIRGDHLDEEILWGRISKLEGEIDRMILDRDAREREWQVILADERRRASSTEVIKLQEDLITSRRTIRALENQIEDVVAQVDEMTKEQGRLESELIRMRQLNDQFEGTISTLKLENMSLSEENRGYKHLIYSLEQELDKNLMHLGASDSEWSQRAALVGCEREVNTLTSKISSLQDILRELEGKSSQANICMQIANEAEEKALSAEERASALEEKVRESQDREQKLEEMMQQFAAQSQDLLEKLKKAEADVAEARLRVGNAEVEAAEAREALQNGSAFVDDRLKESQELFEKQQNELRSATTENARLIFEVTSIRKELTEYKSRETKFIQLKEENELLRSEIESLVRKTNEMTKQAPEKEEKERKSREETQEMITNLKRKVETLEVEKGLLADALVEQRKGNEVDLAQLRLEMSKQRLEVEKQLAEARINEKRIQAEVQNVYDLLGKTKKEAEQFSKEGEELRREAFNLSCEKGMLVEEISKLREKIQTLESEIRVSNEQRDLYKNQVETNADDLSRANKEIVGRLQELNALRKTYEPASAHNFTLKGVGSETHVSTPCETTESLCEEMTTHKS